MKVLWFEVTEPTRYANEGTVVCGWQDSLERIVKINHHIELTIAFMSKKYKDIKVIEGVTYIPIYNKWSYLERTLYKYWDVYVGKMLPCAKEIIENTQPDLIHIFGSEWPFACIKPYTNIPIVIHIMGAIVPYNNANYPPGYSYIDILCSYWWNPKQLLKLWISNRNNHNREFWERKAWSGISNYMGRTQWDESLSRVMHPGRRYWHVDEALRDVFTSGEKKWLFAEHTQIKLFSTGCSNFWKGPDMMLKVAKILKKLGVNFIWQVVGQMDKIVKRIVEHREGVSFEDCNVHILGFKKADEFVNMLCSSTIYVHTAYIENSPNAICEAQCLGVPIVSSNVGGISSLVREGIDGVLVPANDPWQMADAIIQLAADKNRMLHYSQNSRSFALNRHNDNNINKQLLQCYYDVLNSTAQ